MKEEQTGWRDENLSREHRLWGHDCPMVDIDFLCVEYDNREPKAIIEYKRDWNINDLNLGAASIQTLIRLSELSRVPLIVTGYSKDLNQFQSIQLMKGRRGEIHYMDRIEYVKFLYNIRRRPVPSDVIKYLRGVRNGTGELSGNMRNGESESSGPDNIQVGEVQRHKKLLDFCEEEGETNPHSM